MGKTDETELISAAAEPPSLTFFALGEKPPYKAWLDVPEPRYAAVRSFLTSCRSRACVPQASSGPKLTKPTQEALTSNSPANID